jgi:hypothetical protein
MIDLDIPTDNPPQTNTLLHWLQTGLTPSTTPTQLNTTSGTMSVFLLQNGTDTPAPIAAYRGPNPPARIPLSHRYTQILVDTSEMAEEGEEVLRSAAETIRGFDAQSVLERAGLGGRVVAGNFYNVTNPGPVMAANGTAGGNGSGGGAGGGQATGTGVGGGRPSQTVVPGVGAAVRPGGALMGAFVLVGMVMMGL